MLLEHINYEVPSGRIAVEMDSAEYDRVRDALGKDWEWEGTVILKEGK